MVDSDALLREVQRLRPLAHRLLRRADADDLVQDAIIAALETRHPPRHALSDWLTGVVRNLARMQYRGQARRARRERNAAPPPTPIDPLDATIRFEVLRVLVLELDRLPQSVRASIHLRYFEGLSPKEIAHRLEESEGTIRARLCRGIDRLRHRLDERFADRRTWSLAMLLSLRARPRRPLPAPSKAASLIIGSSFIVTAFFASAPHDSLQNEIARSTEVDSAATLTPTTITSETRTSVTHVARDTPPSSRWFLSGRLMGLSPDHPWTTMLEIRPVVARRVPAISVVEVTPDPTGTFALNLPLCWSELEDLEALEIRGDDPRHLIVHEPIFVRGPDGEQRSDAHFAIDLDITTASIVTGQVITEDGQPVEGAIVHAKRGSIWYHIEERTDCEGCFRFRLPDDEPCTLVVSCASENGASSIPSAVSVAPRRNSIIDVGMIIVDRGLMIEGRAVAIDSSPLVRVHVHARLVNGENGTLGHRSFKARTDDEGRFHFMGLTRGRYIIQVGHPDEHHPLAASLGGVLVDAPSRDITVIESTMLLAIEVKSNESHLAGASVSVEIETECEAISWKGHCDDSGLVRVRIPPESRARIVAHDWFHESRTIDIDADLVGSAISLDLPAEHRSTSLHLVAQSSTLRRVAVQLLNDTFNASFGVELEDGEGLLEGIPCGQFDVTLRPGASDASCGGLYCESHSKLLLEAGAESTLLIPLHPAGGLRLRVENSQGRPVEALARLFSPDGEEVAVRWMRFRNGQWMWSQSSGHTWDMGDVHCDRPLEPGPWKILIDDLEGVTVEERVEVEPFQTTRVVVALPDR